MKALARIESNPRTQQLLAPEMVFGGIALRARFNGTLSILKICERFDPILFAASNSTCQFERKRLTELQFKELQALLALVQKRDEEPT